jgi:hypothetical protein
MPGVWLETRYAAQNAGFAAPSADEPVAPADGFKVSGAIRVVTKEALELGKRTRKWQIRAGQDDGGHRSTSFPPLTTNCNLGRQPDKHGMKVSMQLACAPIARRPTVTISRLKTNTSGDLNAIS